jgi:hypothetical protein
MWLAGGFFMALVATQSFHSVDRILAQPHPVASVEMKALGTTAARLLLRYEASELNRWLFEAWEIVQLIGGAFVFFYLLFGTNEDKISLALVLLILITVLLQRFLLTPEIISVGRTLDFIAPDMPSAERSKFWVLHSGYTGVEIMKWVLIGALGMKLMSRRRGRSGDAGNDFDLIDKPNYRHVDR